jgi:hypothetical protein
MCILVADYVESFQPVKFQLAWPKDKILLKHSKRLRDQNSSPGWVSARFALPVLKFQPWLKLSLNGFILRASFIFKYFTYNYSLTQVK